VPLVQHRGEWVELRPEEVEAALRMFARGASGQMSAAEVLRLAHGAEEEATALPVVEVEAGGWLAGLLDAGGDARIRPAAAPAGFAGTLRPYQRRGLSWLAYLEGLGLGACLADDMGLGKTVQLLALLLARRAPAGRRRRPPPTLLVCPMSLVGNWQREAERFAPELAVHVHHGGERLSGPALRKAVRGSDLVITTYALAARDREELAAVDWARVVLDEAQNVKNPAARQTQAVKSFRAPSRIALTGTPVENRLSELWSILDFLNPGLLGTAPAFRRSFATPIERYRDAGRAEALQRVTRPFILRRLKTDRRIVRDLPAKQEMKVYCNLTREQASLYQATVDEMLERIAASEGIGRKGLVLSTLLRLKQVCNHPAQFLGDGSALDGRSGKLARLQEVLEEVAAVGDRALVFTQFREMGTLLQRHLEPRLGFDVPFLHGGTPRAARDEMVARFQGEGGPPVFLLSLKAGGTGLNLTAANQVIHFDRWWNPAVEDQATDRAFRIGQRRDVQVRKLVCAGTLEERIDAIIEAKKQLAASVLGTGEAWLTELSTAELRRIVALSADAVAE
jgi:SNF2 family DNA or RNA helicase